MANSEFYPTQPQPASAEKATLNDKKHLHSQDVT